MGSRPAAAALASDVYAKVADPFTALWGTTARSNTAILEEMFPGMQPSDELTTIALAKAALERGCANDSNQSNHRSSSSSSSSSGISDGKEGATTGPDADRKKIAGLKGHLVETPLEFLREEKGMLPTLKDFTTYIVPRSAFN